MAWRMDPLLESPFEVLLVESQKNQFGAARQNGTRTESLGNISDLISKLICSTICSVELA